MNLKIEYKIGIKLGVILGFIVVVIGIIRYTTGMIFNEDQRLSYLYWVIFFIVNLIAVLLLKSLSKNRFLLMHVLKIGMIIGLISSFMYLIYLIILNYIINPELSDQLLEISKQKLLNGNLELTTNQITELNLKKSSSNPFVRGTIYMFISTILGIIYSGIGGVILKVKRNNK